MPKPTIPPSSFVSFLKFVFHQTLSVLVPLFIHDLFISPPPPSSSPSSASTNLAIFFLLYWSLLIVSRVVTAISPSVTWLELNWLCNSCLLISGFHRWLNRPVLLQSLAIAVGIDQILWYADLASYVTAGKFAVGVAKYMTWPTTSYVRKLTSTHHLWTIPLILYMTYPAPPPSTSFLLSITVTGTNVLLSRLLTPHSAALPPNSKVKTQYLNVNLSHEVWKDIKFSFLQITHPSPSVYLPKLICWWCLFNAVVWLLLNTAVRTVAALAGSQN